MTETLVTLSHLQLEFHLTLERLQEQEVLLDWDWSLEVNLTNQAMNYLHRFQFHQALHYTQYQVVDRMPLPWEDLPVVQILTLENWNDTQTPYSSGTPSLWATWE